MPRPPSRAAQRAHTRAALVTAAAELILERGFHAAGIREITARAGLSLATFYLHFESKEALVAEIGQAAAAFYDEALLDWIGGEPNDEIARDATTASRHFLAVVHRHATLFRLVNRDWADAPEGMRGLFSALYAEAVAGLAGRFQKFNPALTAAQAALGAEAALAAAFRLARLSVERPHEFPRAEVVAAIAHIGEKQVRR